MKCLFKTDTFHSAVESVQDGDEAEKAAALIGELKEHLPAQGVELLLRIEEAIISSQREYWTAVIKQLCGCASCREMELKRAA